MRIVDQPAIRPHRCAVLPYVGGKNGQGFIDSGSEIDGWHIYVSFEAACEMARMLGWVGPSVKKGLEAQIASLQSELDQTKAELLESNRQLDAIDYIGRGQMKPYKKTGRPKKETSTAKAA